MKTISKWCGVLIVLVASGLMACSSAADDADVINEPMPSSDHTPTATPTPAAVLSCDTAPQTMDDDPAKVAEWNQFKPTAFAALAVADSWHCPELLSGALNSIGWEDSASISPDGTYLEFSYFRGDLLNFLGDPSNYALYQRGPDRGVNPQYTIDAFHVDLQNGDTCAPEKLSISADIVSEAGMHRSVDGHFSYSKNSLAALDDIDLYVDDVRLPNNVNEAGADEADPHYLAGELYFWQTTASDSEYKIWRTKELGNGIWTDKELLGSPINLPGSDSHQPHLTPTGDLYFTSNRDGLTKIFVSQRLDDNVWATPQEVLAPTTSNFEGVIAVGEPTLTADGEWLYFVVIFRDQDGEFESDVARVRRSATCDDQ